MSKAMLFGFCLGDGWLSKTKQRNHDSYYYQIGFSGDEASLRECVLPDLEKIFGSIGKATIRTEKTNSPKYNISGTTSSFVGNTMLAREFLSMGMNYGKKVEIDYEIPEWILSGDKNIKSEFLSGFYSAEGYTPSFQRNNKTLKPMAFRFYKRKSAERSKNKIVEQWKFLLSELKIKFTYEETSKFTCEDNFVCTFVFSNEHSQIIHQLSLLDLKYSQEKEAKKKLVLAYYLKKDETIKKIEAAQKEALENLDTPALEIAMKHGVNRDTIYQWRKRPTKVITPKSFMTFDSFAMSL